MEKQQKTITHTSQCDDIQLSVTYEMRMKEGDWDNYIRDGYEDTLVNGQALVCIELARGGSLSLTYSELKSLAKHLNDFSDKRTDNAIDFTIEALEEQVSIEESDNNE
jgi:hypothetical protein